MPCFSPLTAWRSRVRNESGKRGITFKLSEAYADERLEVPCGQCIGCRVRKSRAWAIRCIHEASLSEHNCFVTLTYNDENMPGELKLRDLQLFMKRLRERVGVKLRYFAVGEYGEKFSRPHYHILLFGYDFADKVYWCGKGLSRQYRSALLESVWPFGFSTVGSVTAASAQYVAQYCAKVVTGKRAEDYYGGRSPEFLVMSRRPGLGTGWLEKYGNVLFERDFVITEGGARVPIPRFYLEKFPADVQRSMKYERMCRNQDNPDNRGSRSLARAIVAERKLLDRKRGYDNG